MIYIIENSNHFKIGFTNNWESRKLAYNTHNPDWREVLLMEGSVTLESLIKKQLKVHQHRGEWFLKFDNWLESLLEMIEDMRKFETNIKLKALRKSRLFSKTKVEELFAYLTSSNSDFYEDSILSERWGISKRKVAKEVDKVMRKGLATAGHCYKGVIYRIENEAFSELDERLSN